MRRFLSSVTFHPVFALALLVLMGPLDGCPLG